MGLLTLVRAILVRLCFACHGILAIWRLFMVTSSFWCWYLSAALFGLFIETLITIAKKRGNEWKWFCPSVFFYLLSVVPAIWFLELHAIDERIKERELKTKNITNVSIHRNLTEENLNLNVEEIGLSITIDIPFDSELWLRVLEQFLLLMLIVGRWILPKGSISHDQLSQLLLVYVGTAADIVEFYEAFSEEQVKYNKFLCYIILGIWTLSLLQFTLVLTATKARRDQVGLPMQAMEFSDTGSCCNPELYGILTSIILQDLPFLCVRLTLIFWFHVVSYTNMFFTSKNSLVIILLIYRLIIVQHEARKKRQKHRRMSQLPMTNLIELSTSNGGHKNGKRPQGDRKRRKSAPQPHLGKSADTLGRRRKGRSPHPPSSAVSLPGTLRDAVSAPHLNIHVPQSLPAGLQRPDSYVNMQRGASTPPVINASNNSAANLVNAKEEPSVDLLDTVSHISNPAFDRYQ